MMEAMGPPGKGPDSTCTGHPPPEPSTDRRGLTHPLLGTVTALMVTASKVWWQQPGPRAHLRAPAPWQRAQGGPRCQPEPAPGPLQESPPAASSEKPPASPVGGPQRTRGPESARRRLVRELSGGHAQIQPQIGARGLPGAFPQPAWLVPETLPLPARGHPAGADRAHAGAQP